MLVFLDSHIEANVNWLPPLLDAMKKSPQIVVCPFIDVIDYETFAYRYVFLFFLVADKRLYKRLCPSVGWSVGP